MSPHIQEAVIGGLLSGLLTAIPLLIAQLIALGSLKRMFRDFPPHRHENGLVIYPKGYGPGEVRPLKTRTSAAGAE